MKISEVSIGAYIRGMVPVGGYKGVYRERRLPYIYCLRQPPALFSGYDVIFDIG